VFEIKKDFYPFDTWWINKGAQETQPEEHSLNCKEISKIGWEAALKYANESATTDLQHLKVSMLELASTLDAITYVDDATRFIRGVAMGIRARATI
jgi:hypothetical protein